MWASTGGRFEENVVATSLGTTTAWPPPWAERTSAVNTVSPDLGTLARIDQLPGARQQARSQQNLDHIANQERQHPESNRLAERQMRQQHESGNTEDVDDDVAQRHHADGRRDP